MFEVRHLKVGDFAWICRPRRHPATGTNIPELILPYIVERKRMDDLARSIKDGRFHEQKVNYFITKPKFFFQSPRRSVMTLTQFFILFKLKVFSHFQPKTNI